MPRAPSSATLAELKDAVGPGNFLDSHDDLAPYLTDFRRLYQGAAPLVLRPNSVDQVARILRVCNRDEVAVVPHGGNTSYCGGATPDESGSQIVVSLQRLNRVRQLDAANYSMIVEVGCTLAGAQTAARDANRLFPLSLGSEGTAQIGGNLSTNAGGTAVLRYGMMRDLVLGLEVVLADGRVLCALKSLRKDNTGYDVKSLFIGAEGTLGIITAASLKLFPVPADTATALVGIDSPRHALDLLARLRSAAGDQVTSFELMPRIAVDMTVKHIGGVANPLSFDSAWYLLIELSSPNPQQNLTALLTAELEDAAAAGAVKDAMLATSLAQAQAMWKLRESVPEAQRRHGASIKHDVSVPVSAIPELIEKGSALALRLAPEGDVVSYGHAGDGNLHFNLSQKAGADAARFSAERMRWNRRCSIWSKVWAAASAPNTASGGSKRAEFARRADPVELAVMHALKKALDPKGILNPGKVLCAS